MTFKKILIMANTGKTNGKRQKVVRQFIWRFTPWRLARNGCIDWFTYKGALQYDALSPSFLIDLHCIIILYRHLISLSPLSQISYFWNRASTPHRHRSSNGRLDRRWLPDKLPNTSLCQRERRRASSFLCVAPDGVCLSLRLCCRLSLAQPTTHRLRGERERRRRRMIINLISPIFNSWHLISETSFHLMSY